VSWMFKRKLTSGRIKSKNRRIVRSNKNILFMKKSKPTIIKLNNGNLNSWKRKKWNKRRYTQPI